MTEKPTILRPGHIEDRDGSVVVTFNDDNGHDYEIAFNTMDATHFIGAFREALGNLFKAHSLTAWCCRA